MAPFTEAPIVGGSQSFSADVVRNTSHRPLLGWTAIRRKDESIPIYFASIVLA